MDRKIAKIEKDMLRRVSQILFEVKDERVQSGLVSVSKTEISRDLRVLKVHVTVLANDEEQRLVLEALHRARRFVRGRLGENLDLRYTPEVRFYLDDTPEKAARIQAILSSLKEEPAPDREETATRDTAEDEREDV
jgi:ribosome-binding factor A